MDKSINYDRRPVNASYVESLRHATGDALHKIKSIDGAQQLNTIHLTDNADVPSSNAAALGNEGVVVLRGSIF